jgi:hypothetical protein
MGWDLGPLDVITLGLGLVLISTGNLIMFADRIARAAGIPIRGIANPAGLFMFAGLWVFGLGILTALFPVGVRLIGEYYGWALLVLAVLGLVRLGTGYRRFLD